jgi:hypothetical protein
MMKKIVAMGIRMHRRGILLLALACLIVPPAGVGSARGLDVTIAGAAEPVFLWQTDRCEDWHVPDAPARAYRDAEGRVHLLATHYRNRAMVGQSLDELRVACGSRYRGAEADDPAAFDDKVWIVSPYTDDGVVVHALGHQEYQGHLRPERCAQESYMRCWRNAVIQLRSEDGGRRFTPATAAAPPVVAALPYRYSGRHRYRSGYFNPSNIFGHEGYHYAFVFAERFGAQRRGACLIRTHDLADPDAWRAWDGNGFGIRFVDPYRETGFRPEEHVCTPVPGIAHTVLSVVRHTPSGLFVAVMTGTVRTTERGDPGSGILVATSRDLIRWSRPRMLLRAPLLYAFGCGEDTVYGYPSLIDASSPSRNFETVDRTAHLYLTRLHVRDCRLTADRDLIRFPVVLDGAAPE